LLMWASPPSPAPVTRLRSLSRRFALVPAVEFAQHFYSGDRGFPGYRERLLSFGLGVAFQTGR